MKVEQAFEYDPSEILLRDLEVRTVKASEVERFNRLLEQEHYLGETPHVGEMLRQVITYKGRWQAILLWGPCAYRLKERDEWIGWDPYCAKERKKLVVQNRRFLVLGKVRKPNLASKALALACKHLPHAWEDEHGYRPTLAETFTDPEQVEGTCYKAAGWEPLGFSKGFKRHRAEYYIDENKPKKLWVKKLHNQGKYWLSCPQEHIPAFCQEGLIKDSPDRSLPLKADQIRSLQEALRKIEDPRENNSKFPLSSLLVIVCMGLLCGYHHLTQIQALGCLLTQKQRKMINLPLSKNSKIRSAPSYTALYNLLKKLPPDHLSDVINEWSQQHFGELPKSLAMDGKSIRDRVHIITMADHNTGAPAAMSVTSDKGKELPQAQQLLESLPSLENTVITADALHCQKKRQKLS